MAYLYLVIAATLWGVIGVFTRYALDDGLSSYEIAFWRAFIAGICFFIHAILTKKLELSPPKSLYFALFGAISIALFFSFYPMAIEAGGAALSVILLYTAPVWVAIFSKIIFKERLTTAKLCAIILGIFGVFLVSISTIGSMGEFTLNPKAIIFGLLAGFFYACYYPFLSYFKDTDPISIYTIALPTAAFILFFFVDFAPKSPSTWLIILALGIFSTYLSFLTYGKGLKILGPIPAVLICNLEPVVGTFLAWLVWDESFTYLGYIGAIFVILSASVTSLSGVRLKLINLLNLQRVKKL